jgi:hypothetical protein
MHQNDLILTRRTKHRMRTNACLVKSPPEINLCVVAENKIRMMTIDALQYMADATCVKSG